MTLASGTHLGPYEVLAPIGAGGMGEVYRARDPRPGRDVAVRAESPARSGLPSPGSGERSAPVTAAAKRLGEVREVIHVLRTGGRLLVAYQCVKPHVVHRHDVPADLQ